MEREHIGNRVNTFLYKSFVIKIKNNFFVFKINSFSAFLILLWFLFTTNVQFTIDNLSEHVKKLALIHFGMLSLK